VGAPPRRCRRFTAQSLVCGQLTWNHRQASPELPRKRCLRDANALRTDPRPDLRTVIVLASLEADQSIRGWLRHGADVLGVDFLVIELDQDWRSRITAAQTTQLMVNLPAELVDDLLEDPVQEP